MANASAREELRRLIQAHVDPQHRDHAIKLLDAITATAGAQVIPLPPPPWRDGLGGNRWLPHPPRARQRPEGAWQQGLAGWAPSRGTRRRRAEGGRGGGGDWKAAGVGGPPMAVRGAD